MTRSLSEYSYFALSCQRDLPGQVLRANEQEVMQPSPLGCSSRVGGTDFGCSGAFKGQAGTQTGTTNAYHAPRAVA